MVALLTVSLFTASIAPRLTQLRTVSPDALTSVGQLTPADMRALAQLGLSSHVYAAYFMALEVAVALVFAVVGAVIAWRRSEDALALFVSLTLFSLAAVGLPPMLALAMYHPTWDLLVTAMRTIVAACFIIFLFLFPDGQFVPAWTRAVAVIWALSVLVSLVVPELRFPGGVSNIETPTDLFVLIWFLFWLGLGVGAQVFRYQRVSTLTQRQQTKWVVFGLIVQLLMVSVVALLPLVIPSLRASTSLAMMYRLTGLTLILSGILLVPITIGIAIFRYRLYDIDILINRTLVYGTLTALLALLYWGGIVLLQQLFRPFVGSGNNLVIIASTLATARLVQPLRRRIQATIDRRFYRRKYDAAKTLQAFSRQLRDEVDLNRLTDDLLAVVEMTMQPSHVSLWLPSHAQRERSL